MRSATQNGKKSSLHSPLPSKSESLQSHLASKSDSLHLADGVIRCSRPSCLEIRKATSESAKGKEDPSRTKIDSLPTIKTDAVNDEQMPEGQAQPLNEDSGVDRPENSGAASTPDRDITTESTEANDDSSRNPTGSLATQEPNGDEDSGVDQRENGDAASTPDRDTTIDPTKANDDSSQNSADPLATQGFKSVRGAANLTAAAMEVDDTGDDGTEGLEETRASRQSSIAKDPEELIHDKAHEKPSSESPSSSFGTPQARKIVDEVDISAHESRVIASDWNVDAGARHRAASAEPFPRQDPPESQQGSIRTRSRPCSEPPTNTAARASATHRAVLIGNPATIQGKQASSDLERYNPHALLEEWKEERDQVSRQARASNDLVDLSNSEDEAPTSKPTADRNKQPEPSVAAAQQKNELADAPERANQAETDGNADSRNVADHDDVVETDTSRESKESDPGSPELGTSTGITSATQLTGSGNVNASISDEQSPSGPEPPAIDADSPSDDSATDTEPDFCELGWDSTYRSYERLIVKYQLHGDRVAVDIGTSEEQITKKALKEAKAILDCLNPPLPLTTSILHFACEPKVDFGGGSTDSYNAAKSRVIRLVEGLKHRTRLLHKFATAMAVAKMYDEELARARTKATGRKPAGKGQSKKGSS